MVTEPVEVQYFPKGTNFDYFDYQQINNIQKRPRKILNFKNPKEIFFYNFAA